MSPAARTPTFSIIIEWENVRFIDLDRTREMLRILRTELKSIQPPPRLPEVLFLYTVQNVPETLVRQVLAEDFKPDDVPAITRVMPTDNLRYYEQKNFGAKHTTGEIKILLDSDVLPEPGWLAALLKSFEDPRVHVAAGQTYMAYDSFYTRAFALFWCWPLRDTTPGLTPSKIFHANNVAYRSEIFDAYPFPNLPTNRDQCTMAATTMCADGVGIFYQKEARAAHPPPDGFWNFIKKGINDGRDQALLRRYRERSNLPEMRHIYWNFAQGVTRNFHKFRKQYRDVGLSPVGAVAGFWLAVIWYGLKAFGEFLTVKRPELVTRLFPV